MNEQSKVVGWRFWGRWVLMVIAGLLAGMVVFITIGITVGEVLDQAPPFVFGLVMGLFLVGAALPGGGMMWLLKRTHQAAGQPV